MMMMMTSAHARARTSRAFRAESMHANSAMDALAGVPARDRSLATNGRRRRRERHEFKWTRALGRRLPRARASAMHGDEETTRAEGNARSRARRAVDRANEALEEDEAGRRAREDELRATAARTALARARSGAWDVDDEDEEGLIKMIVTDVDGTLLNSKQKLSVKTASALQRAARLGVRTVVATGKTRGPWARDLYSKLGRENRKMPGLFIQGLVMCDGRGKVLESRTLERGYVKEILRFAEARGCVVIAFCGDEILCSSRNASTDRVLDYGEPAPIACGDLLEKSDEYEVNKLLMFGDEDEVAKYRAEAENLLDEICDVTVAVPGMLEFLPKGASKGAAVRALCESMDVDPAYVLALGDGDNDKEMLSFVGLGIAVGNASEATKAIADVVLDETNDEDAVAAAVEKYVLEPRNRIKDARRSRQFVNKPKDEVSSIKVERTKAEVEQATTEDALSGDDTDSETERGTVKEENFEKKKAAAAEKFLNIARAVAQGTQLVSEALVSGDEYDGITVSKVSKAKGRRKTVKVTEYEDIDLEKASKESEELLERQRANQARLEKLMLELEMAKTELEQRQARLANEAAASGDDTDERERIRSETNKIKAQTSLKKAVEKANKDAKQSQLVADKAAIDQEEEIFDQKTDSNDIFGFVKTAFERMTSLSMTDAGRKQNAANRDKTKSFLLTELIGANGGRNCSPDSLSRINGLVEILEELNPTKKPAQSPLMLGLWNCVFTDCPQLLGDEGLGTMRSKEAATFFAYDLKTERCEIDRGWPLRTLRANVTYTSDTSFELDIPQAKLPVLGISSPLSAQERNYSTLTVTYLDSDIQVCRGAEDTIYVFVQNDPDYRLG